MTNDKGGRSESKQKDIYELTRNRFEIDDRYLSYSAFE